MALAALALFPKHLLLLKNIEARSIQHVKTSRLGEASIFRTIKHPLCTPTADYVSTACDKTTPAACKEAGFTEQTYYRWRKEYGGLKVDQAKRLKELEQENSKLKRLVAELSLDKQILQDIARGNF